MLRKLGLVQHSHLNPASLISKPLNSTAILSLQQLISTAAKQLSCTCTCFSLPQIPIVTESNILWESLHETCSYPDSNYQELEIPVTKWQQNPWPGQTAATDRSDSPCAFYTATCNEQNRKSAAEVQCTLPPQGGEKKQLKIKGISSAESCRNPTQRRDSCNSMQGILGNEPRDRTPARKHAVFCYK